MSITTSLDSDPQISLPMPARYAMATAGVLAPALGLVAIGLHPVGIDVEGADAVRALAGNLDAYLLPSWLYAISAFLWVPALLMAGRVARMNAPTLGLVGLVLAFGLAISVGPDPFDLDFLALRSGLDVDAAVALAEAADELPSAVLGFGWLLGLIGLIVLGVAILRGKSAPAWSGIALIVAPLAIPVGWFSGSVVALSAAWAVLVVGFAGCAYVLISPPAPIRSGV